MRVPKPVKEKKRKKRKKTDTVASLKKKLWKLHSLYIRLRDKDFGCISCHIVKPYKEMHAGHFFEKSTCTLPGYFSFTNVNGQCPQCNSYKSGNKDNYSLALERHYGPGILQELDRERKEVVLNEHNWLVERIELMKSMLAEVGVYL